MHAIPRRAIMYTLACYYSCNTQTMSQSLTVFIAFTTGSYIEICTKQNNIHSACSLQYTIDFKSKYMFNYLQSFPIINHVTQVQKHHPRYSAALQS